MRGRTALLAPLLTLLLALGAGCGGEPGGTVAESPGPAPSATATPDAASQILTALQASVADLGAVEVSGGTLGHPELGRRRGTADLRTGEFHATLGLGNGQQLEMMRRADLTWTKAPPWYWVRLGYTRSSAQAARGKWVVATAAAAEFLVNALDPGSVVRSLLALDPGRPPKVEAVRTGDLKGNRVLDFHQTGADQLVYVTPGRRPRLLRVTSTASGVTTVVNFTARQKPFRVRLPQAGTVFQP